MGSSPLAKALVTFLVVAFEAEVGRRSWSAENHEPVDDYVAMSKRTMTLFLYEFMRVEVFSCCFATCHKEKVVYHQSEWIGSGEN